MNHQSLYQELNPLKSLASQVSSAASIVAEKMSMDSSHAMFESASTYSIVMNLLGTDENDLRVRVDLDKREIIVLVRKETKNLKSGCFWVFGVPAQGLLEAVTTRFKGGVLEIDIPKYPQTVDSEHVKSETHHSKHSLGWIKIA